MWLQDVVDIPHGLSWCHGSILGVTIYCRPSHQLWERCVTVKAKIRLLRRPGSIPLQSSFLVRGTTLNGGVDGWASRAAHVMGAVIPECSSARRLRMVREDTGAPSEGATCAWMVADKAVRCKCAFLTMWRSSQRLVYQGCSEPGLRVNDISHIHRSQHLLTTQSEQPN
ncbi:uncharacterized protein TNCV_3046891 [Trichonephila clavipes]|nr:uncharacterized protein TNCV_3046891 [Trichonephila clavipes]